MDIVFRTKALKKCCEKPVLAQQKWGPELAKKVMLRLSQVLAAPSLNDLTPMAPIRRHKLTGNRRGQYALDLEGRWRLILQPLLPNGESDVSSHPSDITRVRVEEVTDYHD